MELLSSIYGGEDLLLQLIIASVLLLVDVELFILHCSDWILIDVRGADLPLFLCVLQDSGLRYFPALAPLFHQLEGTSSCNGWLG